MDMTVARENIEAQRVVNIKPALITVEAEAALPGSLREKAEVYIADADAYILGGEAAGGRVTADGRVSFHAVYAQGDMRRLLGLDAVKSFSQTLTAQGETKGEAAEINLTAQVQQVSTRVFNGRLLFSATVQVSGQALFSENESVLSAIDDAPGIQTQHAAVKSVHAVGRGETEGLIQKELPLPENTRIAESLFGTASAQVEDITGGADGKLGISGTIRLTVYHAGKEGGKPLCLTRHEFPFEQSVILSGALGDSVRASAAVYDVAVALKEGADAPILRTEVLVHTKAASYSEAEKTLLTDLYGTGEQQAEAVLATLPTTREIREISAAESGKTQITLPEGSPRMGEPLAALARPILLDARRTNDRLTAEGALLYTLIYLPDGGEVPVSISAEEPFSVSFKVNAEPGDTLRLTAHDVEMTALTGDRAEVKYILRLSGTGFAQDQGEYATDIVIKENGARPAGIDLYFVQPEETLWALGKRTRTAADTLRDMNPQLGTPPTEGEVVMIYQA